MAAFNMILSGSSDGGFSVPQIQKLLASHVPPDPVAFSMLPPESRELLEAAPGIITQLLDLPAAQEARIQELTQQAKDMAAALEMYARNTGDVMFSQNLELCLQQVRKG